MLREEHERLRPDVNAIQKNKKPEEERMNRLDQDIQKMEAERQNINKKLQHMRNEGNSATANSCFCYALFTWRPDPTEQAKMRRLDAVGVQEKALREEMERISLQTAEKEKRAEADREREWSLREKQLKPNVP